MVLLEGLRVQTSGAEYRKPQGVNSAVDVRALIPTEEYAAASLRDWQVRSELDMLDSQRAPGNQPYINKNIGLTFAHPELGRMARKRYTLFGITEIVNKLAHADTFTLHLHQGLTVPVDSDEGTQESPVLGLLVTPEHTEGDMSLRDWLRDATNAARFHRPVERHLFRHTPGYEEHAEISNKLLRSNMDILSTDPQLARFQDVIQGDESIRGNYRKWPYIAPTRDNLAGFRPDDWRNQQESWQAVGTEILDALDTGLMQYGELLKGNKKYLASMMPFLAAINFSERPNSGPWEEETAVKTSVIAVETGLLNKLKQFVTNHADDRGYDFLRQGFEEARSYLPVEYKTLSFEEALDNMILKGAEKIGKMFPFETTDHPEGQNREADAATTYLLTYGIPELLAKNNIPIASMGGVPQTKEAIEDNLLQEFRTTLLDAETNGIYRYIDDSYLGPDYNLKTTQLQIKTMKKALQEEVGEGEPIDLVKKAKIRREIVSSEGQAAWVHPNAEIAAWAAGEYLRTLNNRYLDIATEFFNRALSTLTGPEDYTLLLDKEGNPYIKQVDPFQATEAWTSVFVGEGSEKRKVKIASPNTSLAWGAAAMWEAAIAVQTAISVEEYMAIQGTLENWQIPERPQENATVVYQAA